MPNFTITPTSGTGDGYLGQTVAVTPTAKNLTSGDKVTIVTISGMGTTKQVTLNHWGIPSIQRSGSGNVPANGGTLSYTINTHYMFMFQNTPSWITISDSNGNVYVDDYGYPASMADGVTFYFSIAANTGTSRSSSGMTFKHYYKGQVSTFYTDLVITQEAGSAQVDYINVDVPSIVYDWDDSGVTKTINVSSNVSWIAASTSGNFSIVNGSSGNGNGVITVKVNDSNTSTASTKTGYVAITDGSITTNVSLTQYRQPRLIYNGTISLGQIDIEPSGETINMTFASDYNWWFYPQISTTYITMKQNGSTITPPSSSSPSLPTAATYSFTWALNDGNVRNDSLNIAYQRVGGGTANAYRNFSTVHQEHYYSDTFDVSPNRIPETGYASSGGGVYTVVVTTDRSWQLSSSPQRCTVSPTSGNGNTTVTVTIPAAVRSGSSYSIIDTLWFATNDGGEILSDSVTVYQYDNYVEPPYINVEPDAIEIPSGANIYSFTVTANTKWSAVFEDWMSMSPTTGGTGVTTHSFSVSANTGAERNGSLDFTPLGAGTAIEHLYVRQSAGTPVVADSISVSPIGASISSGSSSNNIANVTASGNWTITSKPSWMTWSTTAGTAGTTSINWSAQANTTGSSRTGTTVFACGTASASHSVVQAAPPEPTGTLSIVPAQINASSQGDVVSVGIYNNTNEDYAIDYSGVYDQYTGQIWAMFYDGPNPSSSEELYTFDAGFINTVYVKVEAGLHSGTITLRGMTSGQAVYFQINQY